MQFFTFFSGLLYVFVYVYFVSLKILVYILEELFHKKRKYILEVYILLVSILKESALEEKKVVFVDYDNGEHQVSTHVSGLRKSDIPKRYRLRVKAYTFRKDWSVSEVVESILKLSQWDDVEGLLNHWVGRFSRKNFPLLIRVRNGVNWIQFELK